jgi:hypothetical protein
MWKIKMMHYADIISENIEVQMKQQMKEHTQKFYGLKRGIFPPLKRSRQIRTFI